MKRSSWPWLLAGGVALGGLVYYLADRFPGALSLGSGGFRVVYLVALLALVMSGLLHRRLGLTRIVGSAAVWIAIALLLVLGYSYRAELTGLKDRVMGELLPHSGIAAGGSALSFRPAMDAHFYVEARVEGVAIRFLVDTGASRVVLSQADARRIGIDPARLDYSLRIATANGEGARGIRDADRDRGRGSSRGGRARAGQRGAHVPLAPRHELPRPPRRLRGARRRARPMLALVPTFIIPCAIRRRPEVPG